MYNGSGMATLSVFDASATSHDWVTQTPDNTINAALVAFEDETFDHLQEIRDITRDEFIALKRELARLRGLA